MAIITISRGSFSHGKEIAEKVAEILGYECVSREILLEASQYFKVSEKKLLESIHDAPSLLDRITHGREKYIAYIRAAILDHVQKDNVVYHGHAGHLLIPEVPHVLKVRVLADMEERIAFVQSQRNISRQEAAAFLAGEDRQRALWTRYLYKVDIRHSLLYTTFHLCNRRISCCNPPLTPSISARIIFAFNFFLDFLCHFLYKQSTFLGNDIILNNVFVVTYTIFIEFARCYFTKASHFLSPF